MGKFNKETTKNYNFTCVGLCICTRLSDLKQNIIVSTSRQETCSRNLQIQDKLNSNLCGLVTYKVHLIELIQGN